MSGFLDGIRIVEIADERGEYCGKVLAGLGADVLKIEPPEGESTRRIGPFAGDRAEDPSASLHYWHYNFGKRAVAIDLESRSGQQALWDIVTEADVMLLAKDENVLKEYGLGHGTIGNRLPGIVVLRISDFGLEGPWADFKGSDLIHLALGGVVMNCGYDPTPSGTYDLPPVAPQMWQSYHLVGELSVVATLGALYERDRSGVGQEIVSPIHQVVAQSTEQDLPNWLYSGLRHFRQTGRHSHPHTDSVPTLAMTKDGRWMLPYMSYARGGGDEFAKVLSLLSADGMTDDLEDPKYADPEHRSQVSVRRHMGEVIARWVGRYTAASEVWRWGQDVGLTWGPIRKPEENVGEDHWTERGALREAADERWGRFTEIGSKWVCPEVPWRSGPSAPSLPKDITDGKAVWGEGHGGRSSRGSATGSRGDEPQSRGPALRGVRVLDLGWMLASGGAGRFLASQGAEVIKVEHMSRPDGMRWFHGIVPKGGRPTRQSMGPGGRLPQTLPDRPDTPNQSGYFMEMHSGKLAISLNLKDPRGKELFEQLVSASNVVSEGFSPGTMTRMGLGYTDLRAINESIIYVQQSGMGEAGKYGGMRSFGPTAQGLSGLTDMSGLPEPHPPAGIGYSYLDWFGAYNMATAISAALFRQARTGDGCWIDASQVEVGLYLSGTAVLDHAVNGRQWQRYGNRSPYKPAAPHGVYRAHGEDRWIAIACFTEDEWAALVEVLGVCGLRDDGRFTSLDLRLRHQDELDYALDMLTRERDAVDLMYELQEHGVPAGVCQTAQDRLDIDPQLAHLGWLTEVTQSEIGRWPVREFPVHFEATPTHIGGPNNRHGPNYAEDNDYVFGKILGLSARQIRDLSEQGVL